jgi:hypothetical protein
MRKVTDLAFEVLIIAIIASILLFPIHFAMTGQSIRWNERGTKEMFIGSIILVSSIHIIFEFLGINESWCNQNF